MRVEERRSGSGRMTGWGNGEAADALDVLAMHFEDNCRRQRGETAGRVA